MIRGVISIKFNVFKEKRDVTMKYEDASTKFHKGCHGEKGDKLTNFINQGKDVILCNRCYGK